MFKYVVSGVVGLYGGMRYGMFGKHQILMKREHMDDISQSVPLHWSYGLFEGFSGLLYDRRIGLAWPENGWASHWYFRPVDLYFQDTDGQCFMIGTISKTK